jgi:hypothetical protein
MKFSEINEEQTGIFNDKEIISKFVTKYEQL